MTQADVARATGIKQQSLSAYERGQKSPSLATLDRILNALNATLTDLGKEIDRLEGQESPSSIEGSEVAGRTPEFDPYTGEEFDPLRHLTDEDADRLNRKLDAAFMTLMERRAEQVARGAEPAKVEARPAQAEAKKQ